MAQEIQNVMKEIKLEKVVLNMGLGKSGDAVEIAKKALVRFTGGKHKVFLAKSITRFSEFFPKEMISAF